MFWQIIWPNLCLLKSSKCDLKFCQNAVLKKYKNSMLQQNFHRFFIRFGATNSFARWVVEYINLSILCGTGKKVQEVCTNCRIPKSTSVVLLHRSFLEQLKTITIQSRTLGSYDLYFLNFVPCMTSISNILYSNSCLFLL